MPKSDPKFVNFSQVHELKYILIKYSLPTTEEWQETLKEWGLEAKKYFDKKPSDNLTHDEFYSFIEIFKDSIIEDFKI